MPSPFRYNSKTNEFFYEFEEVYHIIKVIKRGKYNIIGQLYSPSLASGGFESLYGTVELKTYIGGEIELIVSHEGNSKQTQFSCDDEIDDMFWCS